MEIYYIFKQRPTSVKIKLVIVRIVRWVRYTQLRETRAIGLLESIPIRQKSLPTNVDVNSVILHHSAYRLGVHVTSDVKRLLWFCKQNKQTMLHTYHITALMGALLPIDTSQMCFHLYTFQWLGLLRKIPDLFSFIAQSTMCVIGMINNVLKVALWFRHSSPSDCHYDAERAEHIRWQ